MEAGEVEFILGEFEFFGIVDDPVSAAFVDELDGVPEQLLHGWLP